MVRRDCVTHAVLPDMPTLQVTRLLLMVWCWSPTAWWWMKPHSQERVTPSRRQRKTPGADLEHRYVANHPAPFWGRIPVIALPLCVVLCHSANVSFFLPVQPFHASFTVTSRLWSTHGVPVVHRMLFPYAALLRVLCCAVLTTGQ